MSQNLGRIYPNPRGQYSITAQYYELDEVIYTFQVYRVKKNVSPPVGTLPTDTNYFIKTGTYTTNNVCLIDKYLVNAAGNKIIPIDAVGYDKLELTIDVQLSAASLIYVDTGSTGITGFPALSTYASNYSSSNNYDELLMEAWITNYDNNQRRTKVLGKGKGFTANAISNVGDITFIRSVSEISNAINVVGLNSATMTGSITLKKYKYITSS
jgi:hypothetical protein